MVQPFWCRLTQVVLEKRPLNGCRFEAKAKATKICPRGVLDVEDCSPRGPHPCEAAINCRRRCFVVVSAADGGCMDGRARWYRLRMCRPTSYHQHSRSASFDAGGGGGGGTGAQFHGGGHNDAGDGGSGGTGRRRTTPAGDAAARAPSGTGRAATTFYSTTDVIHIYDTLYLHAHKS